MTKFFYPMLCHAAETITHEIALKHGYNDTDAFMATMKTAIEGADKSRCNFSERIHALFKLVVSGFSYCGDDLIPSDIVFVQRLLADLGFGEFAEEETGGGHRFRYTPNSKDILAEIGVDGLTHVCTAATTLAETDALLDNGQKRD